MTDAKKFHSELAQLSKVLQGAKRALITAPGAADGDSIGAQLSLQRMIRFAYPKCETRIVNDEPLPDRYLFLPDVNTVDTPETYAKRNESPVFDVAFIVDGGIDRAGRVKEMFERATTKVFIDHHKVSADYAYTIRIVDPNASSTTELMYHLSQTEFFQTPVDVDFSQQIYLGLIFDTGFFRHSNTTPESMELGAKLLRTGFDFTQVGERGMLARTFASLKLMSDTLSRAELRAGGRIIWAALTQAKLKEYGACDDDREGIIDHLFLTHGIEIAVLFFELPNSRTKVSFRSQGSFDVATFARSLTEHGGGHAKAAGASLTMGVDKAVATVLERLESSISKRASVG